MSKLPLYNLFRDAAGLYAELLKAMVPVMILVRIGEEYGLIDFVAMGFGPLMELVNLPAATGLIWAATILVNIYAGAAVLISIFATLDLTTAQFTVLLSMMLVAHAIPLEQTISRRAGLSFIYSSSLRIGGALIYGAILNWIYTATQWLQEPAVLRWSGVTDDLDTSWYGWAVSSITTLFWLFWLVLALVTFLKILDIFKISALLQRLLTPVLKIMGISEKAASITMVGVLLGLAFGGGLIIKEARAGHLSPRDVVLSLSFMALCHSLIEDTLFMVALGGDIYGLLIGRFIFAVGVMIVLGRLVNALSEKRLNRYLFRAA